MIVGITCIIETSVSQCSDIRPRFSEQCFFAGTYLEL